MNRKIIVTADNSKTLLIPDINETYHSTKGAFREALHVFIDAGLKFLPPKKSVNIFEMGFGTGLNALVTFDYALKNQLKINYTSIEKYPLPVETIDALDYPNLINDPAIAPYYQHMHSCKWNCFEQIHDSFQLKKIDAAIETTTLDQAAYDIVYYDAFGPRVQPDLWAVPVLQKMFDLLKKGGVLVTYCAQGQFKRNLKAVGFEVEMLPGPPGKREMTRAIKPKQ